MEPAHLHRLLVFIRTLIIGLLLLNGVAAVFGGGNLIAYPDGSSLALPPGLLKHTPFASFLVPGIILFAVNGLLSFVVLGMLVYNHNKHAWFVIAQGVLLTGWIVVQICLIHMVMGLHIFMAVVGLALIACGSVLLKIYSRAHDPLEEYYDWL